MSPHWHHQNLAGWCYTAIHIVYNLYVLCACEHRANMHVPFWTYSCSQLSTFLKVGAAIQRHPVLSDLNCVNLSPWNAPESHIMVIWWSLVQNMSKISKHFASERQGAAPSSFPGHIFRWWEYKDSHAHHSSRIRSRQTLMSTDPKHVGTKHPWRSFVCWLKHKQTNKQANKQTNKQTTKQASKQTHKQLLKPITAMNLHVWRQRNYHHLKLLGSPHLISEDLEESLIPEALAWYTWHREMTLKPGRLSGFGWLSTTCTSKSAWNFKISKMINGV